MDTDVTCQSDQSKSQKQTKNLPLSKESPWKHKEGGPRTWSKSSHPGLDCRTVTVMVRPEHGLQDEMRAPWCGSCTALDHEALKRVVKTARHIIFRMEPPSVDELCTQRRRKKVNRTIKDPDRTSHKPFCLLPSVLHHHQAQGQLHPAGHRTAELLSYCYCTTPTHFTCAGKNI